MSSTYGLLLSLVLQRHQNHREGNVSNGGRRASALATCFAGGGAVTGRMWGNVPREHLEQGMPP